MVQYDPFDHVKGKGDDPEDEDYGESSDDEDDGCSPEKMAKIRVWVEDQDKPVFKKSWWAWPEQIGAS